MHVTKKRFSIEQVYVMHHQVGTKNTPLEYLQELQKLAGKKEECNKNVIQVIQIAWTLMRLYPRKLHICHIHTIGYLQAP